MKRSSILVLAFLAFCILLAVVACGGATQPNPDTPSRSEMITQSEAHDCLETNGYSPVDEDASIVTYVRADDPSVTLAVIDGVVQPSTPGSLDQYLRVGCR